MYPDSGEQPPTRRPTPKSRILILLAVLVVVAGSLVAAVLLTRSTGDQDGTAGPAGPVTSAPVATVPPTSSPTASTTTAPRPTTPPPAVSRPTRPGFGYLPLWPFSGPADAAAWQQSYREGGHQPWHLDADLTALSFTQYYLGYSGIDTLVGIRSSGAEDWVGVGYLDPNGHPAIAGVLHLARIGTGSDAPWEVVGTQDSTLSVTTPAYGATVRSPVTVGGRITGVDESLRVQVVQRERVGEVDGIPAGGADQPWRAVVPFTATPGGVLTIAVSTGGHVAPVERFAITGVRH
jgi:hypothetical protein